MKKFSVNQVSTYEYTFKGVSSVIVNGQETEISVVVDIYDGTVVYNKAEIVYISVYGGMPFKSLPKRFNLPELSLINGVSGIRDLEAVMKYLFLITDITTYGDNVLVSVDQCRAFEDPDYVFEDETDEMYYDTLLDVDALECA